MTAEPAGSGMIINLYAKHERGTIMGIQSFIGYTAPSIGVLLGGLAVDIVFVAGALLLPAPVHGCCLPHSSMFHA